MNQSKLESFIESCLNTFSGFFLAMLTWQFIIVPMFGYGPTLKENFIITSIFTVVSIIRSYIWRRFFNKGLHKAVHSYISNHFNRRQIWET